MDSLDLFKTIINFFNQEPKITDEDSYIFDQITKPIKEELKLTEDFLPEELIDQVDEIAIHSLYFQVAEGYVYRFHNLEHPLNHEEVFKEYKPCFKLINDNHIKNILKLNPYNFKNFLLDLISLLTKMEQRYSWIGENDQNYKCHAFVVGLTIITNFIMLQGFIESAKIKPKQYHYHASEALIVSEFIIASMLDKPNIAKERLKELQIICESKTKKLFHPEDKYRLTRGKPDNRKFVEENKTESEGIFDELIAKKFFNPKSESYVKNPYEAMKIGLAPNANLVSFSDKFKDTLLNEIEAYYVNNRAYKRPELRELKKKYQNLEEYTPEEQESIIQEYNLVFGNNKDEINDSIAYIEEIVEDNNMKEIIIEFTGKQSVKMRKVGEFLINNNYEDYINPDTGKFLNSKILKDSNLAKRTIERFGSEFKKYLKTNHPKLPSLN